MRKTVKPLVILLIAALMLGGCGNRETAPAPAPAAAPAEAETPVQRQDGDRYEAVIVIEGMEETVRYEHIRNDAAGFEMDYDYENFRRISEPGCETFVSVYDDPENAENYLTVRYDPRDAETVAASVSELLSKDYELYRDDSILLERAGKCIHIDASAEPGGATMPEHLQAVYIIPAEDGCRVAVAHYFIVGSEGFGRRFRCMMDTFSAVAAQGEKRITEERAVAAVRDYCMRQDPELEGIVNAGENPVYWEISSGDEQQLVVLFRSYTGAILRYYIDPASGDTYVTEFVPGITETEQRTEERLNLWDYTAG